jgi:anti-sigma factor RsiW
MMRCEHCQPLILDHLYGLLDGPDATAVEAHLRECPACAAARDEAARVQGLIAKAAKGAFPQVRFDAPQAPKPAVPVPVLAMPAARPTDRADGRTSRVATWLPWAVAAAVLLAIPGTVIPVLGTLSRAETARKEARESALTAHAMVGEMEKVQLDADKPRRAARIDLAAAKQHHDVLLAEWMKKEKESLTAARKTTVDVFKTASLQPGAPNEFYLVVNDAGAIANGRLLAEVRDQTDAVIFSQKLDYEKTREFRHQVRLPADVWTKLTPQSELFLVVSNLDDVTGKKQEIQERIQLLGPVYATMLVTDKATYRPGETLYFRSLTLDRTSFQSPTREQVLEYELYEQSGQGQGRKIAQLGMTTGGTELVRVGGDKVSPVLGPDGKPVRGVGCGALPLPADLPEGDYSLVLRERPHPAGYPPAVPVPVVRPIKVRSGAVEEYQKLTGFAAASYAPGDTVEAWAALKFQQQPVAKAEVHAIATADDLVFDEVQVQPTTDNEGRVNLRFTLPQHLNRGDVRLKVTFKTKTGEETVAQRVPVVGRQVIVEFFPEGGNLVAGVPCRVYFRATTPTGQPVDIKGVITDGRRTIAKVETLTDVAPGANRGIGAFTYTPTLGTPVWLKIESPARMYAPLLVPDEKNFPVAGAALAGIPAVVAAHTGFPLPNPAVEGVVMTIPDPVTAPGQPIRVHLRSVGKARNLVVGAYTRGRLSDTPQRVTVEPGEVREVRLMAGPDPRGGVVRVTVFEEPEDLIAEGKPELKPDLKPVAERLVFRKPGESLNLNFTTTPAGVRATSAERGHGFAPGSLVELDIAATNEKGNPAAAILYAAAVNTGVAPGAKDRLLTTHFLIAGEINSPDAMEYADFLLTDHARASEVLDLVLATQGWRRFAEQTPPGYIKRPAAPNWECANLLVNNGQYAVWTDPVRLRDQRRLNDTYWPLYEKAAKALTAAQQALDAANDDKSGESRVQELAAQTEQARRDADARSERARAAEVPVERFSKAGWYGVAGFGLLAAMLGIACVARPAVRLPFGISTAGSVGLVVFLVIALGMAERTQAGQVKLDSAQPTAQPQAKSDAPAPAPGTDGRAEVAPDAARLPLDAITKVEAEMLLGGKGGGVAAGFGPLPVAPAVPPMPPRLKKDLGFFPPPLMPMVEKPKAVAGVGPGGGIGVAPKIMPAPHPTPAPGALDPPVPVKLDPGGVAKMGLDKGWRPNSGRPQITNDDLVAGGGRGLPELGHPGRVLVAPPTGRDSKSRTEVKYLEDVEKAMKHAEAWRRTVTTEIDKTVGVYLSSKLTDGAPADPFFALTPLDAVAISRMKAAVSKVTPLVVREYAAPRPGSNEIDAESPDTILWQPIIVLPADGKTKLAFHLGSAPGGYEVVIAGHTLDGRIGAVRGLIPVAQPIQVRQTAEPARPTTVPPIKP